MWHLDLHLDDSIQGQFTSFYFILSFSWMILADSGMFKTFFESHLWGAEEKRE